MTRPPIAEIAARVKAAPEGPYYVGDDDGDDCPNHAGSGLAVVDTGRDGEWPIARHCEWHAARLIQHAPDDLAALLAWSAALEVERDALRGLIEKNETQTSNGTYYIVSPDEYNAITRAEDADA